MKNRAVLLIVAVSFLIGVGFGVFLIKKKEKVNINYSKPGIYRLV